MPLDPTKVVEANLSALQRLINALGGYSPKQIEGGKPIEHAQMRVFLGSMRGLAEKRMKDINTKYPIQIVKWKTLAPIVYGTRLGNAQKTADWILGDGELKYSFKDDAVLAVGDHQLQVYAEATSKYQKSRIVINSIKVTKAEQVVDWVADLGEITTATPLGQTHMKAKIISGDGPLKFSFNDGDLLALGDHQLSVYAEETNNYNQSPTVTRDITVVAAP